MILVDTSVWIDHLHKTDARLSELLGSARVVTHPFVVGELALGSIRRRSTVLEDFERLPRAVEARHADVRALLDERKLHGRGLTLVDAHLLGSALITAGCTLWTRDRQLAAAAAELGICATPA